MLKVLCNLNLWNTFKHNLITITLFFHDYFSFLELNVSTNISFIDPVQSEIYDLNAKMLVTEETNHEEYIKFSDPHVEITSNRHPITMQDTRNIELIQETLSPKYSPESQVNLQG
jgi:hypothetical protein